MAIILLIAFIAIPLIEIAVFIEVGDVIGLWPTLGLIVLTAMLGTWELRHQGFATLNRAREQMERGVVPARELFDGACLLLAGILLLTPGFVTDLIGFFLFLPPVRDLLRRALARRLEASGETRVWVNGQEVPRGGPSGTVIDAEFSEVEPGDPKKLPKDQTGPHKATGLDPEDKRGQ